MTDSSLIDPELNKIQKGDRVIIKNNLHSVMERLGFEHDIIIDFVKLYAETTQKVLDIWTDDDDEKTTYVTIDLCVEIPLECCLKTEFD